MAGMPVPALQDRIGANMKFVLLALLCLVPFAASAASPEDDYIAARDKFIAQFTLKEGAEIDEQTTRAEERARAELETQLRKIIGPSGVSGAPAQGKSNLDSLIKGEMGFGQLDALTFEMKGDTRLIVTTRALLARWLVDHKAWWNDNNVPQEIDAALRSESFYTQAISTDASVARFAELPLNRPAGTSFAHAMLVMQRQDIGAGTPHDVIVAVARGERVFIWSTPTAVKVPAMPVCEAHWKRALAKSEQVHKKYRESDLKDGKLMDEYIRVQEEGDAAFRKCFGERAKDQKYFARLVKQAQGLVDRVK